MTIYKYRHWADEFHKKLLTQNELFFASPLTVNDPFDMLITPSIANISDLRLIRAVLDLHQSTGIPVTHASIEEMKQIFRRQPEMVDDQVFNGNKIFTGKRFGMISFSRTWKSVPMWAHYSNNHSGFCVGFDKDKLLNGTDGCAAGRVTYGKKFPELAPFVYDQQSLLAKTHFKSIQWKYEKEYRITKLWVGHDPNQEERKLNFQNDCINEVILGINIDKKAKGKILRIGRHKGFPVFQLLRERHSYKLRKEQI